MPETGAEEAVVTSNPVVHSRQRLQSLKEGDSSSTQGAEIVRTNSGEVCFYEECMLQAINMLPAIK